MSRPAVASSMLGGGHSEEFSLRVLPGARGRNTPAAEAGAAWVGRGPPIQDGHRSRLVQRSGKGRMIVYIGHDVLDICAKREVGGLEGV